MDKNSNVEIYIDNVDNDIVQLFINVFDCDQYDQIDKLQVNKLIQLCNIIDRFPTENLNMYNLEYFICSTYSETYHDYYENLISRYNLL